MCDNRRGVFLRWQACRGSHVWDTCLSRDGKFIWEQACTRQHRYMWQRVWKLYRKCVLIWRCKLAKITPTRKHSSRMCTACLLTRSRVPSWHHPLLWHPLHRTPFHATPFMQPLHGTSCGQTNTSEKHYLPTTSFAGNKNPSVNCIGSATHQQAQAWVWNSEIN